MFAIVECGSQQYKVSEGDSIETQLLDAKSEKTITLEKVLFFSDGPHVKIGQPYLEDVKVTAKVGDQHLANKAISFKYLRRKNVSWKKGHRQKYTTLNITKISVNS